MRPTSPKLRQPARATLALFALLLMPAASALVPALPGAVYEKPPSGVSNGDFEDGLAGWTLVGDPARVRIVHPGAEGSASALLVEDRDGPGYIVQSIQILSATSYLEFRARILDPGAGGFQVVGSLTLDTEFWTSRVAFQAGRVFFAAGTQNLADPDNQASVPWPADGGWHTYRTIASEAGFGVLLIDGDVALAVRHPLEPGPQTADSVILGDTAAGNSDGAAPTLEYDRVLFAPGI